MNELNQVEIRLINGGCASSDDPDVQAGMNIGCSIGRAIGATIRSFGKVITILSPFKS